MSNLKYDFLSDSFTTYQNVKPVTKIYSTPLGEFELDDNWSGIYNDIPVAENKITPALQKESKLVINNSEEIPIQFPLSYEVNKSMSGDKKKAFNFFIQKGLLPHLAAGIVGNLIIESNGLKTDALGDSGLALGLAQWHPDRLEGLKNLAGELGTSIYDFNTQLEYVWKELNSSHKKAFSLIQKSTNVDEATEAFMKHFERPKELVENLKKRIKAAKSCLENG